MDQMTKLHEAMKKDKRRSASIGRRLDKIVGEKKRLTEERDTITKRWADVAAPAQGTQAATAPTTTAPAAAAGPPKK